MQVLYASTVSDMFFYVGSYFISFCVCVFLIDCVFHCLPQHRRTLLLSGKEFTFELMYELNTFSMLAAEFNEKYYAPVMIQSDNSCSSLLLS